MRVWLHIGLQKTGTTAAQDWLARASAGLAAQGLHYLRVREGRSSSSLLVHALRRHPAEAAAMVADLAARLAALPPGEDALISSEDISAHPPALIAPLMAALAGHEVAILIWLRRQDRLAEAMYKQMVRYQGGGPSLAAFLDGPVRALMDYDRLLAAWQAAWPQARLLPQVYAEPGAVEASDSIGALMRAIGRPDLVPADSASLRAHPSPRAEVIALCRAAGAGDRAVRRAARQVMADFGPAAAGRDDLLTPAQRAALLDRHAAGNARVCAAWFPGRAALFPPPAPTPPDTPPPPDLRARFAAHLAAEGGRAEGGRVEGGRVEGGRAGPRGDRDD